MANKNLFAKDPNAVRTTKKAEKAKKEDHAKAEVKAEETSEPVAEQEATKAKPSKKLKIKATKEKKPSMVDAALKVLTQAKEPMTCKDLIEAMTTKGLWSSPNGKTPANTLYSAFLRLIQTKGKGAAIRKADKGTFEINPSATA